MTDPAKLRNRLETMTIVPGVLPTERRDRRHTPRLEWMAQDLEAGDLAKAEQDSIKDLEQMLAAEHFSASALRELADSATTVEQVACFCRAGYNFFRSTPAFSNRPLSARRAAGGNGAVRRIRRSGEHLLMETSRLVIRFAADTTSKDKRDVLSRYGLVPLRPLRFANAQQCATDHRDVVELCLQLMADAAVEYAEPDFIEAVPQRRHPSDPEYVHQWHHRVIRTADAWELATGAHVRIAVVGNGFDRRHTDLQADAAYSGWFRPSPDSEDALFIPGLVDLPSDNHGTACAGMAAARGNSGVGGTGVAYDAALGVIACLPDQVGTQLTLARALAYAADPALEVTSNFSPGADVITCSLGPNGASWEVRGILSDAIDFVATSGRDGLGTPLFWAAANGNVPLSRDEVCAHPQTIVVGRSTAEDTEHGSGHGPELDFLAPGVDVWLPAAGGGYHGTTGTSFAAPCAAGVAALMLSVSDKLTVADVRALMRRHADRIGPLPYDGCDRNDRYGCGRINALEVLRALC